MPPSHTYEVETIVPLSLDDAFDLFVDASRYPEWQRAVKRVVDLSGKTTEPGTTYTLDHGIGGKARVTVLEVDRPVMYRLRQQTFGKDMTVTVRFVPRSAGTTAMMYTVEVPASRFSTLIPPPSRLIRRMIIDELNQFSKWIERTRPLRAASGQG